MSLTNTLFQDSENYIRSQLITIIGLTDEQTIGLLQRPISGKGKNEPDFLLHVGKINKFQKLKGNPTDLASKWAEEFICNNMIILCDSNDVFMRFFLNKQLLTKIVLDNITKDDIYFGYNDNGAGKTILIEYSSPNVGKPFHAGHLRSTILGNFIANLLTTQGYHVRRYNYLGDWGKQYGLLAVGYAKYGNDELLENDAVKHLYDVYVKINDDADNDPTIHDQAREYFRKMEDGDQESLTLWKKFRDLSIIEMKKVYNRLNVEFDVYDGESLQEDEMKLVVKELTDNNLLIEENGCQLIDLSKLNDKNLTRVLVTKRDGTSLYITRDLAAARKRYAAEGFNSMYYVVGHSQELHFQQVFGSLKLLGHEWADSCHHVKFGLIKGMSTRNGTAIFLSEILDEAKLQMLDVMKENAEKFSELDDPDYTADIIGTSAVIVQDLTAKSIKDYNFDWDRIISFEGETGPYMQYTHARLCGIERKSGFVVDTTADINSIIDGPDSYYVLPLIQSLAKYPLILQLATDSLEPVALVSYLFDLCRAMNSAIEKLKVKGSEHEVGLARLRLFWSGRTVLANGMKIIGLRPVERM